MQIDEFLELVKKRRSIRIFKPDPIPDECIEKILEAARWAMSGANGQPWEFIVVKDQNTKNKLAEAYTEQQNLTAAMEMSRVPEMRHPKYRDVPRTMPQQRFKDAPVLIVVCADPRTAQATVLSQMSDRYWVIDSNIANATYAINLAAAACGLGSQWVTVSRCLEDLVKPILGVPPIISVFAIVPIGYPAYKPKTPYRRELTEISHYEKYDMTKYRSHEEVQEFIHKLRELSKPGYSLK